MAEFIVSDDPSDIRQGLTRRAGGHGNHLRVRFR